MTDLATALTALADDPHAPPPALDLDRAVRDGRRLHRRHRATATAAGAVGIAACVGGAAMITPWSVTADRGAGPGAPVGTPTATTAIRIDVGENWTGTIPTLTPVPGVRRTPVPLDLTTCPKAEADQRFRIGISEKGGEYLVVHDPLAARASDAVVTQAVLHALRCALPGDRGAELAAPAGWSFDPQQVNDVPLRDGGVLRLSWTISRSWKVGDGSDEVGIFAPKAADGDEDLVFDSGAWDWRSTSPGETSSRPRVGTPARWGLGREQREWLAYLVAKALVDTGVLPGDRQG